MTNKDEQNNKLWSDAVKDVIPLKKNNNTEDKTSEKANQKINKPYAHNPQKPDTRPQTSNSTEIDKRTAQRLKRGQIPLEGKLDLHGMTQNEAYDTLQSFIPNAYNQGKRCILVITGKGSRKENHGPLFHQRTGILKEKTPEWLTTPPLNQYILKIQTARPQHGGDGALYVLLRRKR